MARATEVVAAVDIGGTRIKACLVDQAFAVRASATCPTPPDIAADIGSVVASVVNDLTASLASLEVDVVGCGVVVPGLVDDQRGVGLLSVNLGWRDLDIRDAVSSALGLPVACGHDVRAGLLAEVRLGAGKDQRDVLFVPVGTGIAGGLMLDGAIVTGGGYAGEIGHLVVDPGGRLCPCGATGCLETVASARSLERAYAEASGLSLSAEQIAGRARDGEALAQRHWSAVVAALGAALASVVTLTGVGHIIIGGGLSESGEQLLDPLRRDLADRLTFQRKPQVQRAVLGDRAGSLGAACLAWDALSQTGT